MEPFLDYCSIIFLFAGLQESRFCPAKPLDYTFVLRTSSYRAFTGILQNMQEISDRGSTGTVSSVEILLL